MKKFLWDKKQETLDTLFGGQLQIIQEKAGYRFSIDALLVAHFALIRPRERVIDLGTGCGVIPLTLIFRRKVAKVIGVEIQPALADLARRNASLNRMAGRINIWEKDFKSFKGNVYAGRFDVVITNPPYRRIGTGRLNPQEEKARARHEIHATLDDMLKAAFFLLKDKGRIYMIYPASRTADLVEGLRRFHLEPKQLQFVHSRRSGEARLLLVEAYKEGRPETFIRPPFILYGEGGQYTEEAKGLFT